MERGIVNIVYMGVGGRSTFRTESSPPTTTNPTTYPPLPAILNDSSLSSMISWNLLNVNLM